MRVALFLPGLMLLSACGGGNDGAPANDAEQANAAAPLVGAERVFDSPADSIARANQFGFRAGPYAAVGSTFLSKGGPITLSQSDASKPNTGAFEAAGATADRIDRIVFTLDLTDAANADTAKQRFVEVVRGFLFQYRLDDEGALDAVTREQSAQGPIAGLTGSIDVARGDPGNRSITVTFTRTAGTTPALPDQGQADGNRA